MRGFNFLIHFTGQTIPGFAWNLPASDTSPFMLHFVHGMKPLWSRMQSDSDYKTHLGRPRVQAEATQTGLWAVHRSGQYIVNTSPFKTHKQCSFIGLADAPPLPLSSRAQGNAGRWRQSCCGPCAPPYPDPVFPSTTESAGGKLGGSLLWGVTLLVTESPQKYT